MSAKKKNIATVFSADSSAKGSAASTVLSNISPSVMNMLRSSVHKVASPRAGSNGGEGRDEPANHPKKKSESRQP